MCKKNRVPNTNIKENKKNKKIKKTTNQGAIATQIISSVPAVPCRSVPRLLRFSVVRSVSRVRSPAFGVLLPVLLPSLLHVN